MGLDNPLHIAFLLVILLLVFGAKRLPELGRSLGTGMRGFKESISGDSHADEPAEQLAAASPSPVHSVPAGGVSVSSAPVSGVPVSGVPVSEPVVEHPAVRPVA